MNLFKNIKHSPSFYHNHIFPLYRIKYTDQTRQLFSNQKKIYNTLSNVVTETYIIENIIDLEKEMNKISYSSDFNMKPQFLDIIGMAVNHGQLQMGVETTPNELRKKNIISKIENIGYMVRKDIDINLPISKSKIYNENTSRQIMLSQAENVSKVSQQLSNVVYDALINHSFPIIIGGDHSISIGSLVGTHQNDPDTCVIWIDAHADINTDTTTPSGNMHGMPISIFTKMIESTNLTKKFEWIPDIDIEKFLSKQLIYIGLRDVDPGEWEILKKFNIKYYTMECIKNKGIEYILQDMLLHISNPLCKCITTKSKIPPIHISFDIDAVDPNDAPATGTPVHDGLTLTEAQQIVSFIYSTGKLCSMDMVEVNSNLATSNENKEKTLNAAISIICSALGE